HDVLHELAEFETSLNVLGAKPFAAAKLDHVLHTVKIDQMPGIVDVTCIAAAEEPFFVEGFSRLIRHLVITREHSPAEYTDFAVLCDLDLHARHRLTDTGQLHAAFQMVT